MSRPEPVRSAPAAVIFGCAGTRLDAEEHALFRDVDPLGFILFARNCDTPEQIRDLVAALRDSVGRADAPVLIDQEGGRVARLKPPLGHVVPPARRFGELFVRDSEAGMAAAHTAGRLLASDLAMLGIDVDCAPVLDLARPETTVAIGDRAFSGEVDAVVALGKALAEGLLAGGVLPVVKHMPGHGRARVDSHAEMPSVDADAETLTVEDFAPFKALSDMPMGMTAHIRYTALDADAPATHSPSVIAEAIRGVIGFDGLLLSDDLAMEALDGSHGERAARALAAGCDVALHCTGALADMRDVANYIHAMTGEACRRWRRAVRRRSTAATSARAETPEALAAAFDVFMAG